MTPEMLDALVSAGATADMIAAAWKAEMADRGSTATERRAKDAERKRLSRARPQCPVESGGHDGTDADIEDAPSLDKETSPRPPKEIKPSPDVNAGEAGDEGSDDAEPAKPKPARAVTVGALLSTDWVPERIADGTVAREVADRRGREWYRAALESFKNHWASKSGKDARKRDWQATWRNWIIEQDRRDGGKDGKAGRRGGPEFGIPADGFIAALREAGRAPIADDPPPGHA